VAELADALDSKSDETPSYRIVAIVHVRTSATENEQKRRSESQYLVNNIALKGIRIRASALRVLSLPSYTFCSRYFFGISRGFSRLTGSR
jgi:hypothetical protein